MPAEKGRPCQSPFRTEHQTRSHSLRRDAAASRRRSDCRCDGDQRGADLGRRYCRPERPERGGAKAKTNFNKATHLPATNAEPPIEIQRFVGPTQVSYYPASLTADGKRLLTAGVGGDRLWDVRLWDVASGEQLCRWRTKWKGWVEMAAISPDGRRVAWHENVGELPEQRLMVADVESRKVMGPLGISRRFWWVAWVQDNRYLITGDEDGIVREWDADRGIFVREFLDLAGTGPFKRGAVSPNGSYVAAFREASTMTVWDRHSGNPVARVTGDNPAFAPDSRSLFALGVPFDQILQYSLPDGKEMSRHGRNVGDYRLTVDGRWLVTADKERRTLGVLSAETGTEIGKLQPFESTFSLLALAQDVRSAFLLPSARDSCVVQPTDRTNTPTRLDRPRSGCSPRSARRPCRNR